MIRRPPRSTLFPDTTRFRAGLSRRAPPAPGPDTPCRPARASIIAWKNASPPASRHALDLASLVRNLPPHAPALEHLVEVRSEEHTFELQSRQYLVCRLLLEK